MKTLTAGTPAPAFTLLNQDDQPVSLADFKGGKKVLAYFYPRAMTPGAALFRPVVCVTARRSWMH